MGCGDLWAAAFHEFYSHLSLLLRGPRQYFKFLASLLQPGSVVVEDLA